MYVEDPSALHVQRVKILERAGVAPPAEWVTLHHRHQAYTALQTPCRDALVAAVVTGDEDIAALRALAYAEAVRPQVEAQIGHVVKQAVLERLTAAYSPRVDKAYATIRTQFDAAATALVQAMNTIDPDTDARDITRADDTTRKAWWAAEERSAELNRLLEPIAAGAALCGLRHTDKRETLIALTVDPQAADRTAIWQAWLIKPGTSRGGRWAALVKAGAAVRAHPDPASAAPYGQSDPEPTLTPIDPVRRRPTGRMTAR